MANERQTAILAGSRKILGMIFLTAAIACSTSPRGRKQLLLLPESQMSSMGAQAFTDLKSKTPPSPDPALIGYVKCITDPLTQQVTGEAVPQGGWEVVVFKEDETVNAFALPGGKIGVYTGMLKTAETPAQLAAVIGHEIGHVIARHGNERVSETLASQGGLAVLGAVLKEKGTKYDLLMGALGLGAQFGVLLPHGRTQESEADLIGLELMAKAGFDPRQAPELWRNMAKGGGAQPPEILSTHPSHRTRIANLERTVPEVMGHFEAAKNRPSCNRP